MRKDTYRIRRRHDRWLRDGHDRAVRRRDYAYLLYEESIRAHARIEAGADVRVVWPRMERALTRLLRNAGNARVTPAQAKQWAATKPLSKARESLSWTIFGWSDRWNQDRLLQARALYRRVVAAEQADAAFDRLFQMEEEMGLPD